MSLDYTPLASAVTQLEKSLAYIYSPAALADAGLREQLRNSVIQCFEFTYELSRKMLKRHLEATEASPATLGMSTFQSLNQSMAPPIQISEHDWMQTRQILAAQMPYLEVWAFGSRANGHTKPYSDLDLALITAQPLTLAQRADINDAFASSDMTIGVDVMDWANGSEAFREIVFKSKVAVQSAPATS